MEESRGASNSRSPVALESETLVDIPHAKFLLPCIDVVSFDGEVGCGHDVISLTHGGDDGHLDICLLHPNTTHMWSMGHTSHLLC